MTGPRKLTITLPIRWQPGWDHPHPLPDFGGAISLVLHEDGSVTWTPTPDNVECPNCAGVCGWCGSPRNRLPSECRSFGSGVLNDGHEPCEHASCPDLTPENVESP